VDWYELLAIAVALAMDAFAVAVVVGLTVRPLTRRHAFRLSFHFGLFQALMPILGWTAGMAVQERMARVDHWVAFGLLVFVGGRMVLGALQAEEDRASDGDPTRGWRLVMLATATSIDALAVGLSLAMLGWPIAAPAVVIGLVAAVLTLTGMRLGQYVGASWGRRVELVGGLILIAIGVRIVAEHTLG
jgi:manganese efflux pump family protein